MDMMNKHEPSIGVERSTSGASSSARLESFTEAVPLALSSMAHASVPLEDGVLDGIKQVLQHTLLSCVNYARMMHPPHQWTFRDLATSPFAWQPVKEGEKDAVAPKDLPLSLQKLNFKHQYSRNALIYLKPALPKNLTAEKELEFLKDWGEHNGILGRISLLYISTEPLTQGEMDGTDTDDMPPCILYKVEVEYRSLRATGNQQAVQAEELSMLSFGGSVDDDVKYGALASLYDEHAKYVLEICSVRGKKYKFDLMDSTLSDGTLPRLPSSRKGDPFVKSLCVTVTDHELPSTDKQEEKKYAITRMHLLLEGKPRDGQQFDNLPAFDHITNGIKASFLLLNPQSQLMMVSALPSGHTLLLDPAHAGRIYVNGKYVTTWGHDPRIGSHGIALFGMDLHSIPFWHGRIVNYEALKIAYAQLWHEILIDARLSDLNLATLLLSRLMTGMDPDVDEDDLYDDDDAYSDVNTDCLESQVLASSEYDRVGIAAKALATRFGVQFGREAFPCLSHEVEWVKSMLPNRKPVVVPQRVINILRRGGYFNTQQTADELWFTDTRVAQEGTEKDLVLAAIQLLEKAGCVDVAPEQIAFVSSTVADDVVAKKIVCRYSDVIQQYCIHEQLLTVATDKYLGDGDAPSVEIDEATLKAYLLGMYIAKEHPDGDVLVRYLLRNKPLTQP